MDKNLRNVILSVGLSGFVFLTLFIWIDLYFSLGIGNIVFLGMIMMILGWITVRLALKGGLLQKPLKIMDTVKVGSLSGLVAVIPFLLFGCGHLIWTQLPVNSNTATEAMGPLIDIIIYIVSGIGVLLSSIGGGLGILWAKRSPTASVKQQDELDNLS